MSRRREQKRDKERTLARQLGTSVGDVPHTLLEKPRTAFVSVKALTVRVEARPTALFGQGELHVSVAAAMRTPDGLTPALDARYAAPAPKPGEVIAPALVDGGALGVTQVKVVHHRPAHLVVVVAVARSAAALAPFRLEALRRAGAAVVDPARASGTVRLDDDALARSVDGAPLTLDVGASSDVIGGALTALPSAGKSRPARALTLGAPAAKWRVVVELTLEV